MKDKAQVEESYKAEMSNIAESVRKLAEHHNLREICGIMHGLCEVVAVIARKNGLDFEEYTRCALCAWDCSLEKEENCSNKKDCSSWN